MPRPLTPTPFTIHNALINLDSTLYNPVTEKAPLNKLQINVIYSTLVISLLHIWEVLDPNVDLKTSFLRIFLVFVSPIRQVLGY
jgi:hypothetical protein